MYIHIYMYKQRRINRKCLNANIGNTYEILQYTFTCL